MIMAPESALARLISTRHEFHPGDDLHELVSQYADIEYLPFPVDSVDGISLYLKSTTRRPNIIINSNIPRTRAKFTLAHEFGHVIVPWHFGTIFSNIDAKSADYAYREMEAEANRFAAELLMPENWLQDLHAQTGSPAATAKIVRETCGTSMAAVIIATNNALPPGFIYIRAGGDGTVAFSTSSQGTIVAPFDKGENFRNSARFEECSNVSSFEFGGIEHHWLFFATEKMIDVVTDDRPWREILDEIITDVDPQNSQSNIKASVNAMISICNVRSVTAEAFFAAVRQKLAGKGPLYQSILAHPKFNAFLAKKIEEFMARR